MSQADRRAAADILRFFAWLTRKAFGLLLVKLHLRKKPVTRADLKLPVIAIAPDGAPPEIYPDDDSLRKPEGPGIPENGSILIDSDFDSFTLKNVRRRQGEISMIFRYLIPTDRPFTYKFDLKRRRQSGREEAMALLLQCRLDPRLRDELPLQTSVAGIASVLRPENVQV